MNNRMGKTCKPERDCTIDALRTIALSCIVLAHVGLPQGPVFNARCFDVVCMVMVSAMSYSLTTRHIRNSHDYMSYVWKRARRLLIPTWSFLAVDFSLLLLLASMGYGAPVTKKQILCSFLLLNDGGIGFVWIVRVYLILALIAPLAKLINDAIDDGLVFIIFIGTVVLAHLYLLWMEPLPSPALRMAYDSVILYASGYGIAYLIGMRHTRMQMPARIATAVFAGLLFFAFLLHSHCASIQEYKYPPHPYYLSYGIFVTVALYALLDLPNMSWVTHSLFVRWLSVNSFWVYLWHIVGVQLLDRMPIPNGMATSYVARWLFCMAVGVILTALQNRLRAVAVRQCPLAQ